MAITKNKMVSLTYDLRIDGKEGELIEQATTEKPLQFVYGAGVMLPKFEALIEGLEQGKSFEISLSSKDAYGEIDENAIIELPRHLFLIDGKFDEEIIKVGNTVPMMSTNGQRMNGLVLEVNDDIIKMDFNHPLAGEDLFFQGSVQEIRNATDEEIAATVQGGCGCSGGGCSTENCSDESCSDENCKTEQKSSCGCGC